MLTQFHHILRTHENHYAQLIRELITLIKQHDTLCKKYITPTGIEMLYTLEPDDYIIGHSDEYFVNIIRSYQQQDCSIQEIIQHSARLIWSLIEYEIDEECPVCQQMNLRLFTNWERTLIYECCTECFARRVNGQWTLDRQEVYQANKQQIITYIQHKKTV